MKNTAIIKSKKPLLIAGGVVLALVLVGAGIFLGQRNNFRNIKDGGVIANSKFGKIYKEDVVDALQAMSVQTGNEMKFENLTKDQLEAVVSSLVAQKGVLVEAKDSEAVKNPQFQRGLQLLTENLTKETYLRSLATKEVTEEKMRERYDLIAKEIKGQKEYHVRHILVKTKKEAEDIAATLTRLNFADVAQKQSIDSASAARGGDLGAVLLNNLDEQFAKVVKKQPVGTISKPFETKFGWHIVLVEGSKPAKLPTYEESKVKLQEALFGEFVRDYLMKIAEKSEIKFMPVK